MKLDREIKAAKALEIKKPETKVISFPKNIKYGTANQKIQTLVMDTFSDTRNDYLLSLMEVAKYSLMILRSNTPLAEPIYEEIFKSCGHGKDAMMATEFTIAMTATGKDLLMDQAFNLSEEDLREMKIPDDVIKAISLLGKLGKQENLEYGGPEFTKILKKVKKDPLARIVKMADLIDKINLAPKIFRGIIKQDCIEASKYADQLKFLTDNLAYHGSKEKKLE